MIKGSETVIAVTVTYGDRWEFLSRVIDAVINDSHLARFIIVDNGSKNREEIEKVQRTYPDKIEVIRTENNVGSAGGFAIGLARARDMSCDFVLMLDDDNVLEPDALQTYIRNYNYIEGKRVISGFRKDIQDASIFETLPSREPFKKTFFDVWNVRKFGLFISRLFRYKQQLVYMGFAPIVPTRGFVYGGSFLPIEAVREAPLPDKELVLYGDDVEYSWGILGAGFASYLCNSPIIHDVDMSFEEGDHILGLFNPKTRPFKVYYRIRNMVRISLRNSKQTKFGLHTSVAIWILGLFILGIVKYGFTRNTIGRIRLVIQAVYGGYVAHARVPAAAHLP